ncbi:MAG: glycosyltransferase [Ruminococcaceae bacterium]|nr:glycosyltransferase [Oscillospiraceae bacterium]
MKEKKVTICIPVYNAEKYIQSTLHSLTEQSYSNIQIIVIDNCSTDRTCDIVSACSDPRIKLIKNEKNIGMVGNFNACLHHIDGDYLQIVCADDYLEKDCIRLKAEALAHHPDCVIAISATNIANKDEKVIFTRKSFRKSCIISGKKMLRLSFAKHNLFGEPTNVMLRANCIEKAGVFSEELYYAVDWEYWLRMCTLGDVYYINEPLSRFYLRNDSESSKLIKQYKRILNDDRVLVRLCQNNPAMHLDRAQIILHKTNVKLRLAKKLLFSLLFN